jgi:RNA polymerase sigma factor FliA
VDVDERDGDDGMLAQERRLWETFRRQGDAQARDAAVDQHREWAQSLAASVMRERGYPADIDIADLNQEAMKVLIHSAERFDASLGISFRGFTRKRLRGALLDLISVSSEIHAQTEWRRQMLNERLESLRVTKGNSASALERVAELAVGVAVGVMLEDTGMFGGEDAPNVASGVDPYAESVDLGILARKVNEIADQLKDPDRMTLFAHYRDGKNFSDIARALGVTAARISQIHSRAIRSIRSGLQAAGLDREY